MVQLFSSHRRWVLYALLPALILSVTGVSLAKKVAAPAQAPAPAVPVSPALLRIWKGELVSRRALRVSYTVSAHKSPPKEFVHLEHGYDFGQYIPLPAEDLKLDVFEDRPNGELLNSLPLHLSSGDKVTLLISETGGKVGIEIVNDNPPPDAEKTADLSVRNFIPSLTSLQVSVGDDVRVTLSSAQSFLQVRGLRREALEVDTSGTQAGKSIRWTNEVDFSQARKATVLIYPDPYGRIRPRVVVDDNSIESKPSSAEVAR